MIAMLNKIECYELNKLKTYLDKHEIKYVIKSDPETAHYRIERVHFNINGYKWSVIHGYGTYGGFDPFTGEDKGLLELYTTQIQPDPFGCLTCTEVIDLIESYRGE